MKVLIACEESQAVCKEFRRLGHEAYSCDILPCSGEHPEWHIQGDVEPLLKQEWDMIIAFPPCTHLANSGAKHFKGKREDGRQRRAIDFFMLFLNSKCKMVAIENPMNIISGKYILEHFPDLAQKYGLPIKKTQTIQPYEFGDAVKKTTWLWLKGLPNLNTTKNVEEEVTYYISKNGAKQCDWYARQIVIDGKKYGYNTPEFKKHRSKTFPGIAKAMAEQWGSLPCTNEKSEMYRVSSQSLNNKNNQHTKSDSSQPLGDGCKVVENQEDKNAEVSPINNIQDGGGALSSPNLNKESSE